MNVSISSRRDRQRGVTLLEALVALVVLSLGLLGIAKLNAYLVATAGQSKARMEALAFAEQKIEDLRNQLVENETTTQDYASLVSSLTTDCTTGAPTAQKDTRTGVLSSYTRVWCKLGTAMDTQVQVSVFWNDRTNAQQTVTLQSVIAWDSPLKSVAFAETGGGTTGQAFAKPPTGRAFVGKGTVTVDNSVTPMVDNLRIQKDPNNNSDNYYRLVDASGNVLLTATAENESFSIITGRVYIDDGMYVADDLAHTDPTQANYYSNSGKVATREIFVSVSDAAYCSKVIASPIAMLPTSGTTKYDYFDYRCYVGAGWYGNVGISRIDKANNNELICLGDPGVAATETVSNSRKPVLSTSRMYRGYETIATNVYESTGIGIDSNGNYTAVTYAQHDFLVTTLNGQDTCATAMSLVTSPSNPFTGNQGRFYCLSSSCPSPLPNVGTVIVQVAVGGNITLQPASSDLTVRPSVSALDMYAGSCTLGSVTVDGTTGVGTQPYTCTMSLQGWAGAAWSGNMTVTQSGGTMCASGASGPGTVTAGSNVISFTDQSVTNITVSQSFTLAVVSGSCP
jgi:Tfp pilus assembly protein PilV